MADVEVSFEQLDALYEIVEAARREFFAADFGRDRQSERERQLKLAYQAIAIIGEYASLTGNPSDRLRPLTYRDFTPRVQKFLEAVMEFRRQYDVENDPWWADTLRVAPDVVETLGPAARIALAELWRMGIVVEIDRGLASGSAQALRRNEPPPVQAPIM